MESQIRDILARVQGLVLDGMTPYNLGLLRPEVAMLTLSAVGIALELRRRRGEQSGQPAVADCISRRTEAPRGERLPRTDRPAS